MKVLKEALIVNITSIVLLLLGIFIALIIPYILDVESYAIYGIFTYYIGYYSILRFGLSDYHSIRYSNVDIEDLKSTNLFHNVRMISAILILVSVVLLILHSVFSFDSVYLYLILAVFPYTLSGYFMTVYSTTKKFGVSSVWRILNRVILLIVLIIMLVLQNYRVEIILCYLVVINLVTAVFSYIYFYKNSGKREIVEDSHESFFKSVSIGFPMVLAYIIGNLAVGLDRIFIEFSEPVLHYSIYTFANSVVNRIIMIMMASSLIVLPNLSRLSEELQKKIYNVLGKLIILVYGVSLIIVPLVKLLIDRFYVQYTDSFKILILLLPVLLFRVMYHMKVRPYFYLLNLGKLNLIVNIFLLGLSSVFNLIVYFLGLHYFYYAIATILVFYVWLMITEEIVQRRQGISHRRTYILYTLIAFSSIFISLYNLDTSHIILLLCLELGLICILYRKIIFIFVRSLMNRDLEIIKEMFK